MKSAVIFLTMTRTLLLPAPARMRSLGLALGRMWAGKASQDACEDSREGCMSISRSQSKDVVDFYFFNSIGHG